MSCYVGRREGGMNGFSLEEVGVMGRQVDGSICIKRIFSLFFKNYSSEYYWEHLHPSQPHA